MKEEFDSQNSHSHIEEIAPEMIVHLVPKVIDRDGLAVSYNSRKYTEYLIVGYSVLLLYAVVTADNVIVLANLQNSVENVLTVLPLIKGRMAGISSRYLLIKLRLKT